jgi:hypothetical protein
LSFARAVRIALLLSVGPVLALTAADRAIVSWRAHWLWVAREVPPLALDPYRLEGILRTTPPGRENVVLLGNSVAEQGFDGPALERRFAARGLRFPKLTLGGAPALTFGMLARDVAALEPALAVLVIAPPSLRSEGYEDHVFTYDAAANSYLVVWAHGAPAWTLTLLFLVDPASRLLEVLELPAHPTLGGVREHEAGQPTSASLSFIHRHVESRSQGVRHLADVEGVHRHGVPAEPPEGAGVA